MESGNNNEVGDGDDEGDAYNPTEDGYVVNMITVVKKQFKCLK